MTDAELEKALADIWKQLEALRVRLVSIEALVERIAQSIGISAHG